MVDFSTFADLHPGDARHLDNPFIRLLIRRAIDLPLTSVFNDLDSDELLELERYLWIYGGEYWRPVVYDIHKRLTRPVRSSTSTGDNVFQRAKNLVRLEDFASRFTELKSSGSDRLKARCPLHKERKGYSFVVYLETQTWHCFGRCGAGGDVVELGRRLRKAGIWKKK